MHPIPGRTPGLSWWGPRTLRSQAVSSLKLPKITKSNSLALFAWLEQSQAFFYQDEGPKRQERVMRQHRASHCWEAVILGYISRMLYLIQINLLPSIIYYTEWMLPNS